MRMSQLDWAWVEDFDQIVSVTTPPKIKNAMVFLTKNDFIMGANNPPGQMVIWVDCTNQSKNW